MHKKSFNNPDQTMTPPKAKVEIIKTDNGIIVRNTFEPGWKWSEHAKPMVGTDTCQVHHLLFVDSGHLVASLKDGSELEVGPGDVADIPAGHDAWVAGDDPVVSIDLSGLTSKSL